MKQRRSGLAGHARVAVGCPGNHALEQAEDTAHPGHAIERRHEMHLAGAGIGEAGIDAGGEQRPDKTLRTVHREAACVTRT